MPDDFIEKCVARSVRGAAREFRKHLRSESAVDTTACGSPLEAAFWRCWMVSHAFYVMLGYPSTLRLEPQAQAGKYRLDFAVRSSTPGFPLMAVELDGHEFHEITREQVANRNRRDRDLMAVGWRIFRFSGSEFYRNPTASVCHVFQECFQADRARQAAREGMSPNA